MSELVISELNVSIEGKQILNGVNLKIKQGEVHAIMGPNGTGKSTLANTLMGHPSYTVNSGSVTFKGQNLLDLKAWYIPGFSIPGFHPGRDHG
jgi:Fe-S cluster assembly ATP-binding protein